MLLISFGLSSLLIYSFIFSIKYNMTIPGANLIKKYQSMLSNYSTYSEIIPSF